MSPMCSRCCNSNEDSEEKTEETLLYELTSVPPVPVMFGAAMQHMLVNLVYALAATFIVSEGVCAPFDSPLRTQIFCTTMLICGVCTLLQTAVGIRLPIFQGPSASFFPVLVVIKSYDDWTCPTGNMTSLIPGVNETGTMNLTDDDMEALALERLQKISGSMMAASILEILVGSTGLVGFLLRYVGPLTVAPTIALIGLSLYTVPLSLSQASWEIAMSGAILVLIFSLYIASLKIPFPVCGKEKRIGFFPLFELFPILLGLLVMWGISGILTITEVFPNDPDNYRYKARTDAKNALISNTPWFVFPYPGQFGAPSFSLAVFVGFLAGFCASMIESVGDYLAAARACQVGPPPNHAVNRGILLEGLGALLGGAMGLGFATTSYSHNISALTVSRTASRSVMMLCGVILIVVSVVGKGGACLAAIPDPVLGGVITVLCGMLVALGLSALQFVKLSSTRNQIVLGMALFCGICLPNFVEENPEFIDTGMPELNAVLTVALGTPMFVGGVIAVILDNTVKGSLEDRGILNWRPPASKKVRSQSPGQSNPSTDLIYGWSYLPKLYRRCKWLSCLPFFPSDREQEQVFELGESINLCDTNRDLLNENADSLHRSR